MVVAGGLPVAGVIAGAVGLELAGGTRDPAPRARNCRAMAWSDRARRLPRRRATAVTAGTVVPGCQSSFISGGDWLISGRGPGMNNSPFLSVVVGMVPVCCSDLLPWGNHPPFTTRVSRLGAVTPPAGRSAGVTGRHGCVTAHEPLTGRPAPGTPSLRPHRPA